MRIAGNAGSEDRKKFYAVCGFVAVAAAVLYFELGGPSTPAAPPPVVVTAPASAPGAPPGGKSAAGNMEGVSNGSTAKVVGTTSAALDPTLHMDAMLVTESVEYGGTGRNIFSAVSAPPPMAIPKATASARPQPQTSLPAFTKVQPPVPQTCPPQCPPIDMKFCGYFVSPASGDKQAVLLHGEDVFLASTGDIVMRRYRVISISANSIQVEDMPNNNNRQTLPLLANP